MAYATTTELQAYLGGSLPSGAERLLERASELIDYYTFGRIQTSIAEEAAIAKKATMQQVEFWVQSGEDWDITGTRYDSISIGTYQQTLNNNATQLSSLSPRARRTLFLGGMLYRGVRMI